MMKSRHALRSSQTLKPLPSGRSASWPAAAPAGAATPAIGYSLSTIAAEGSKESQTSSSHTATRSLSPARRSLTRLTRTNRAAGQLDAIERILAEIAEIDDLAGKRIEAAVPACARSIAIFSGRTATDTLLPTASAVIAIATVTSRAPVVAGDHRLAVRSRN